MTTILLNTLADALGGAAPTDALIKATASRFRSSGADLTAPKKVTLNVIAGVPESPFVLDPSGLDWYWTIQARVDGKYFSRHVTVPDAPSVEWADLVDIDPRTMEPDPSVIPVWELAIEQAQATADAAKVTADNSLQLGYKLLSEPARPILGLQDPVAPGAAPQGPIEATIIFNVVDATPSQLVSAGQQSLTLYGGADYGSVPAKGTAHGFTALMDVQTSSAQENEHSTYMGWQRYKAGALGRAWFTDYSLHGPIGTQPGLLSGINMLTNNYYNGSPLGGPSAGQWIITKPGQGAGREAGHEAATTYKLDVGLGIVGFGGRPGAKTRGYEIGIQIGGTGSGWMTAGETSIIGTGMSIRDTVDKAIGIVPTGAAGAIMWGTGTTGPRIQPVTTDGLQILTSTAHKLGFYGKTPVAQAAAIASPAADVASLKTAVDALRAALTGVGVTA